MKQFTKINAIQIKPNKWLKKLNNGQFIQITKLTSVTFTGREVK